MPIELGSFSLGASAGTAVGAVIGHYLTKSRDTENRRIQLRNATGEEFRNILVASINKIENGQIGFKVIKEDFPAQRELMIRFTHYLSGKALKRFRTDWDNYQNWYKDVCCRDAADCIYPPEGGEEFQRKRSISPSTFIEKLLVHTVPQ